MSLQHLFLQHCQFIKNLSPRTVAIYAASLKHLPSDVPSKTELDALIIRFRQTHSAGGTNVVVRSVNSYLSWLHAEGHTERRLRLKVLKTPELQPTTLTADDIRRLMMFKPEGRGAAGTRNARRAHLLILVLLDCGLRISEALGLQRGDVDLVACTFTVTGKGSKQRTVPFSLELRKRVYRQMQQSPWDRLFCTRDGLPLRYRNVHRDLLAVCRQAGVTKAVYPHLLRHTFACHFVRSGGDIYRLSRILGHTSVVVTQGYLRGLGSWTERLSERLSPLAG